MLMSKIRANFHVDFRVRVHVPCYILKRASCRTQHGSGQQVFLYVADVSAHNRVIFGIICYASTSDCAHFFRRK